LKKRLISLFLLIVCGLAGFIIDCGLLGSDDDGYNGDRTPTTPTTIASAIPAWSPDGEWIAIAWTGNPDAAPRGIHLIRPDGTDFHLLFSFNDFVMVVDVCWSPDGEWLAFNAYNEIWKIKPNGDSLTRLTYSGENYTCTWSLSDTLIAYSHSTGDMYAGVWLMNINGINSCHFIKLGGHIDFGPGDSLFYESSINSDSAKMSFINITDSTEREIYRWKRGVPYHTYYDPEVSPDGKNIAFAINSQIRKLSTEGTNLQTLTVDGGRFPHWSPDGNHIVYCETDTIGYKVKIMHSDGSEKRLLIDFVEYLPDSLK
jgi:Tol biopolymer transport system component